jgi:hypothetical protein
MSKSNKAVVIATPAKATKVTLNSIVLAVTPSLPALAAGAEVHAPEVLTKFESDVAAFVGIQSAALADYLVDKSDSVNIISQVLSATVALIPAVLEREAENIAKRKADREAGRTAAKAKREAEQAEQLKVLEAEKEKMLNILLTSGIDLTAAKAAVEFGVKAKIKAAAAPASSYERVTVEYNGTRYEMPVKGNMGNDLKAIVADSKLDRDEFIKAYKVEATETAETETAGE